MALKKLPQSERLLSGTLSAYLTEAATTIDVSTPPDADRLPTYIEIEPDAEVPETVRIIGVSGNTITIERGVYTGGVGVEHQSNSTYKQKVTTKHWQAVVDAMESGYLTEDDSYTLTRTDADTFRVDGVDFTTFYTAGRILRLSGTNIAEVISSSFTGGNTVVEVSGTVPNPLTSVELSISPKGATDKFVTLVGTQTLSNKTLTAPVINVGSDATGDIYYRNSGGLFTRLGVGSTGQALVVAGGLPSWGLAGASFWGDVPGTPTRVSDTQFTITDTSNANLYDLLFKKGVVLKWLESSTFQTAMVISSSYATNTVTINLVGDSLTAGFTSMKYAIPKIMKETFIIPGTIATGTDLAKTFIAPSDIYIISADAYHKTAGTTNATTYDINDDGTTKFTTKPSIASAGTSDIDNVADNPSTAVAAGSLITVDVDSVSTTAPVEAYIDIFYYPVDWRYR